MEAAKLRDRKIVKMKYVLISIGNKKIFQQKFFFLIGPAFTPPPFF